MHRWITPLCVAALASACGGEPETPPGPTAAIDTVDGVPTLSYAAEPAPALGWSLDTVAVVGDAFGEDVYQFDQVGAAGLAGDDDGNLFLLDRSAHRVLQYGPDGAHRATYGREGEGPGELQQPLSLAADAGDTVWVSDFGNTRITGYPRGGGEARGVRYADELGFPRARLERVDGTFLQVFRPGFGFGTGGPSGGEDGGWPLLRLSGAGAVLDTLWTTRPPETDMIQIEAQGRRLAMAAERTFSPDFHWATLPDGSVVVADSAAYLLRLLDPDGTERLRVARAPAPRATTEADREAARDRVREQLSGSTVGLRGGGSGISLGGEAFLEQRLASMRFADVIPRVAALAVDPVGRIWVGVSEDSPEQVERIDVYDADGRLMGELREVPFPDVFYGADRAAQLMRDDLDVQHVVLYRLSTGGAERMARR